MSAMNLIRTLLAGFLLLLASTYAEAQSPVKSFVVYMEVLGSSSLSESNPSVASSDTLLATAALELADTSGITSVVLTMGSAQSTDNLFSKEFAFGQSGTFPDGTSCRREGNIIYLCMGRFTGLNHFTAESFLRLSNQSVTPAVTFTR